MSNYSEREILNSKLATRVLFLLAERQSYGTEIAKDLDKSQTSVDRVIQALLNLGFVEKGKRTRAQYYKISYEGMSNYWYSTLHEALEVQKPESEEDQDFLIEGSHLTEDNFDEKKESINEQTLEDLESHKARIKIFAENYFRNFFESRRHDIQLHQILFDVLYRTLITKNYWKEDSLPDYISTVTQSLKHYLNALHAAPAVKKAIDQTRTD